jgi:anti-sigma B factor antagonist
MVVEAVGEIDIVTAPDLRDALLTCGEAARVVVDLSAVTFLDCAGLSVIARAQRRTAETCGSLSVVAPTGVAARVLRITHFEQIVPLHATLEDAITARHT